MGKGCGTEPVQNGSRTGESALALHQRKPFIIIIEELPKREQIRFHPRRVNIIRQRLHDPAGHERPKILDGGLMSGGVSAGELDWSGQELDDVFKTTH